MMNVSHKTGAYLLGVEVARILATNAPSFNPLTGLIAIAVGATIGASLPDADTMNSRIGHKYALLLWPIWLIQSLVRLVSLIPGPFQRECRYLNKVTRHRGLAHTPIFWIIIGTIPFVTTGIVLVTLKDLSSWFIVLVLGIYVGVISHLFLDWIFDGIMLLFPLTTKRFKLSPFHTGGFVEKLAFIAMVILLVRATGSYIHINKPLEIV